MMRWMTMLATLALSVAAVHAEVGDLTAVACNPNSGVEGGALLDCQDAAFVKPKADSGTTSPTASIAMAKYKATVVAVAVDSKDPAGKQPDCVRLDFTGKGKFTDEQALPLKVIPPTKDTDKNFRATFGPSEMKIITRDGRTIPAMIAGEYQKRAEGQWLGLKIGTALEGPCQFGEKTYTVRIIDGNGNQLCGDPMRATLENGKLVVKPKDEPNVVPVSNGTITGDSVLVDVTGRQFRGRYAEQLFGQPVWVDGHWYDVTVSADRTKVAAKPLAMETGRLKSGHPGWSMRVISDKYCMVIVGIDEPDGAPVPAGRYAMMGFHEYIRGDQPGQRGTVITRNRDVTDGKPKMVEVLAGKTTEAPLGTPLTGEVLVTQEGRKATLKLRLTDVGGGNVDIMRVGSTDGFPTPPQVEILDAKGAIVHTAKLTAATGLDYTATWALPENLAGEFSAVLKANADPCTVTAKKTTFTLK